MTHVTLRGLLWFLCVLYITDGAKSALNMCKTLAPHFTNFEEAQTCYNACSYNSPPLYASVTALIEKAFIWLRDGANFEAAVAYRQIACDYSRPPPSVLFNLYLAVLPINTREAVLCLSELIDQSPGDDEALIALAELQLPYLPPQRHLEERLDRCIGIIEDRIKKAEIVVDGALARLYAYRAALAARRGYPVEATKYFRSAFSLSDGSTTKMKVLGISLRFQVSPIGRPKRRCDRHRTRKGKSIAFVGITAGCGRAQLIALRERMEALGTSNVFDENYHVFILENDSRDGTREALAEWSELDPCRVHVDSIDIGGTSMTLGYDGMRTTVLAMLRNRAMKSVRQHFLWPFDFVMWFDMDLVPFNPQVVVQAAFSPGRLDLWNSTWSAVCANGVMGRGSERFYDVYAFRSHQFPHSPLDDPSNIPYGSYWGEPGDRPYLLEVQRGATLETSEPPIEVDSCFSGLAIYRGWAFNGCSYTGEHECEHVRIHECMRNVHKDRFRIFMIPEMQVEYRLSDDELDEWRLVEENYARLHAKIS